MTDNINQKAQHTTHFVLLGRTTVNIRNPVNHEKKYIIFSLYIFLITRAVVQKYNFT